MKNEQALRTALDARADIQPAMTEQERGAVGAVRKIQSAMKAYHRTSHAAAILADGFKDGTGSYFTDREWSGVWFSDIPLDENDGAVGDTVLVIDIPENVFSEYEWIEEGIECKRYREALIPAAIVNGFGPPEVCDE